MSSIPVKAKKKKSKKKSAEATPDTTVAAAEVSQEILDQQKKERKRKRKQEKAAALARESAQETETLPPKKKKKKKKQQAAVPDVVEEPVVAKKKSKKRKKSQEDEEAKPKKKAKTSLSNNPTDMTTPLEDLRKSLDLTVSGDGADDFRPMTTFDTAFFAEDTLKCCADFKAPSAIQAAAWPPLLKGRDVIGIAETGSGKTLGFLLPAIRYIRSVSAKRPKGPLCLFLAPTRELAIQINVVCVEVCTGLCDSISSSVIYGGVDKYKQINELSQNPEIVVATPGRLLGLMRSGNLNLGQVGYFVLDEADRMLDMGFEPDIRAIEAQIKPLQERQSLLFSATWPEEIQKLGSEFVKNPIQIFVGDIDLSANHRVSQDIEVMPEDRYGNVRQGKLVALLKRIRKNPKDRVIIFVLYKKEVGQVERFLLGKGFKGVGAISSDRGQHERSATLEAFRLGTTSTLIATDVASRGLDIPDVEHVINYSFPLTVEDYVHRIGRTGRGGKDGASYTFFQSISNKNLAGDLCKVLREANQPVPQALIEFGPSIKKQKNDPYLGAFNKARGGGPMRAPVKKKLW